MGENRPALFVLYLCFYFSTWGEQTQGARKKYERDLDVDSEEVMNLAGVVVGWSSLQ